MSDVSALVDELQKELEGSCQTLGELFGAACRGVLEEFDDGDLLFVDDELFLDLEDVRLRVDPTDEAFLHRHDVFEVGESVGLLPSADE